MLRFDLIRFRTGDQGTVGQLLHYGGHVCWMMELPDRANKPNRGRIPQGLYRVEYLKRSASGRFHDVYWVRSVPGRSGILTHAGNVAGDVEKGYRSHSWGCLLPAARMGSLYGQIAGLQSRKALRALHAITNRQPFTMRIRDYV